MRQRPHFKINRLEHCHNVDDFRALAKKKLPFPVFHYIDGAADDEQTYRRNSRAFDDCDLVPNVLAGVAQIDMSTRILGREIAMPLFLSPTALQRLFHWQGELAVGRAAEKFGTYFGISSLASFGLEEIGAAIDSPKMFQLYVHKDKGLNAAMIAAAKAAKFDALTLTVDTIVGGNRERDLHSGFTTPPKLTPASALSFALHPRWTLNYLLRDKFSLPNLEKHVDAGSNIAISIGDYFSTMLDQNLDWQMAADIRQQWNGPFCLKGIMSASDARHAVEIGASAIMVSNHGGRQLDASRAPFDQLKEIVDAVGGEIEIICDGGIRRGTDALKAISIGANAVSGGRLYLYALAANGQAGVEKSLENLRSEIERAMKLMGVTRLDQLGRDNLRWR